MHIARNLVLALCLVGLVGLTACGGNKPVPPPPAIAQVVVVTQPLAGDFNAPLTIEVQFQDADGNVVPSTTPIGISLVNHPANPVLTGDTLVDAVAGTATFDNLFLDASGTFQIVARGGAGPFEVTSDPFTYGGPPFQLGFVGSVGPATVLIPTPFSVEVQDKNGNPIPGAESVVLINVVKNPSNLLLRAFHTSAPDTQFWWLEPTAVFIANIQSLALTPTLKDMTYHAFSNRVYSSDAGAGPSSIPPFQLYSSDPFTADTFVVGPLDPGMVGFVPRALTEDAIGLLAGDNATDAIYDVDPITGEAFLVPFPITIPGDFPYQYYSMATHPTTGENYAICHSFASAVGWDRTLIRFDGLTLQGSVVGPLPQGMASISFFPNGALYGTTGVGSPSGEFLFQLDPGSGVVVNALSIGSSATNGAAMTTVPGPWFGTTNLTTIGGVANFNDMFFTATGSGFQLQASAPDLVPALSNTFDVNP